jgi:hypothetical protein
MTDQIRNKAKYLFFFFFLIAIKSSAQTVSGIYSGTLVNDSLKMVQNYELALSEYRGKITGYSYITFVSNDTFYYGIKRIKATRQNGELIIEDVEMLSNNYPKRPDKGVHVINRIPLPPGQDTIIDMNGKWETTATKKFYSISGPLSLRRNKDSSQSSLIAHLTELKEINYQDEKKNNLKNVAKTQVKQQPKEEPSSREIVSAETKPQRDIKTSVAQKSTAAMEQPKPEQKPSQVIADDLTPKEVQPKQNVPQQTAIVESKPNKSDPTVIPTKNQIVAQANVAADPVASSEKRIIKERPVVTNSNNTGVQHKPVIANTVQKPTSEQSKTLSVAVPASKEPIQPAVEKQIISNNSDTRTKEPTPVLISSSAVPEQGKACCGTTEKNNDRKSNNFLRSVSYCSESKQHHSNCHRCFRQSDTFFL